MKKIFTKLNLIRSGLFAAMVAIIVLLIPHADHQSYSYEINQPWRYPLLTAQFDMPILRDSATINTLRDSIDRNFVDFVVKEENISAQNIKRFESIIGTNYTTKQRFWFAERLAEVYNRGIIPSELYDKLRSRPEKNLRLASGKDFSGDNEVTVIDASQMFSPVMAFDYIDSAYNASAGNDNSAHMPSDVAKALNVSLVANIVVDTAINNRFREQDYLNVTGALGVIKKGQRIVDRGEIVTPQIFTNLNTYQELLDKQDEESDDNYFIIGHILYVLACVSLLYLYLYSYRRSFFDNITNMVFLTTFITLFIVLAIVMVDYLSFGVYYVPFAALPVIILVFFDSRTALFSLLTAVLITAIVVAFPFQFIFMQMVVCTVATLSIHHLSKRSQLLRTAVITFLLYSVCFVICCLINEGNLANFAWKTIGRFAINSVLLSFAYLLIVVIEKVFRFTSTVTLVELSDINSPLLRRLAEEAPGTFQHSMQVSMLAAEAARNIGANTQLARTGALYHDIGKLENPLFFTENQYNINPHNELDPATSARKIISHITYGLALASKYELPPLIRDFISQHHGAGMAKYFYNTAVNNNPDKEIDKEPFTYPGPNPTSKETTILMMADAVEAASRSLKDYSQESINNLVDKIIDGQERDNLYKNSPISFRDIETVKQTFKKRLATIYHVRIAYPEINKKS